MQTTLSSLWPIYLSQLKQQVKCFTVPGVKPRQAVHVQPGALRCGQQAQSLAVSYGTAAPTFQSAGLFFIEVVFQTAQRRREQEFVTYL